MNNICFPKMNILGVNIAAVNMQWALETIKDYSNELSGKYICFTNVHTVIIASEDIEYRKIQNNAFFAFPDGGPLASIAKKNGYENVSRIAGPSFMEEVFKDSKLREKRHFFYGSTNETLEKLVNNLIDKYPKINIVGTYSPPFRILNEDENKQIINRINKENPDFIWVGLGAPKQEIWMYQHQNCFNGVMLGVGAGFDYIAGNIKRAPKRMQDNNMEWLYRLFQDPFRLFSRYFITNIKFIFKIYIQKR